MSTYRLPFAQAGDDATWARRYPGITFTFDQGEVPNPHPYLAAERHVAYQLALRLCRSKSPGAPIFDVGANVRRAAPHADVFINAPLLMAEDYFQPDEAVNRRRTCACDARDCQHSLTSSCLFCHSSYYFTPQDLADVLSRRSGHGVVITHRFPLPYGTIGVHAAYQLLTPETVAMTVAGGRSYVHPRQAHFSDHNTGQLAVAQGTLMWDLHRSVGDTHIFQLRVTPLAIPIPPHASVPMWNSPLVLAADYCGPTTMDTSFHVPAIAHVRVARAWSFGPFLLFTSVRDESVVVPKLLLTELTILATGRPRTLNSFDALMARAKSMVSKMPPATVERSLAYTVALALTRSAANDELAYGHIAAHAHQFASLASARANAFDHVPTWIERMVAFCVRHRRLLLTVGVAIATAATAARLVPAAAPRFADYCPASMDVTAMTPVEVQRLGLYMRTTIAVPILEEVIKSALNSLLPWSLGGLTYGLYELGERVWLHRDSPTPFNPGWLGPVAFHTLTSPMSYGSRLAAHMAWNVCSIIINPSQITGPATAAAPSLRRSLRTALIAGASLAAGWFVYRRAFTARSALPTDSSADPWSWPAMGGDRPLSQDKFVLTRDTAAHIRDSTAKVLHDRMRDFGKSALEYSQLIGAQLMPAPSVLASNRSNELVAVTARAFPDMFPPADSAAIAEYEAFVFDNFEHLFGPRQVIMPLSFAAFLSHYPAPQRAALERARANLDLYPISDRALCRIKAFIKMEHLLKAEVDSFEMFERIVQQFGEELISDICGGCIDATPRLISGAVSEFNVIVGPWVTAMQLFLTKLWNRNSPIFLAASTTQDDLGAYFAKAVEDGCRFTEIDFTKFDASMKGPLQRIIIRIFVAMGCPKRVAALLYFKIARKHGHTPHGVYFESTGGETNSGDPHTFLGNSIHNALFGAFVHFKRTGEVLDVWRHRRFALSPTYQPVVDDFSGARAMLRSAALVEEPGPVNLPSTHYRALIAGDDSVIAHVKQAPPAPRPSTFMRDYAAWAERLGQLITGSYHGRRHINVGFCSGLFWPTGPHTFIFGPTPTRVLTKHPFQKVSYRAGVDPTLFGQSGLAALRATALGLWPACRRIPILREYLQFILSRTRAVEARLVAANPLYAPAVPMYTTSDDYPGHCPEVIAFIQVRYGFDADTLREFSRYLRSLTLPCEADFPQLRNVYAADQA